MRSPVDPSDFEPPGGAFLVAYLDGRPVGCGGWRAYPHFGHYRDAPGVVSLGRGL